MPDAFVIFAPLFLLLVVGLLRFVGCGTLPPAPDDDTPKVSVTPVSADVGPGQKQDFVANVANIPNQAVVWDAAAPGGHYTAPAPYAPDPGGALRKLTVTATSADSPEVSGSATVTLVPATIIISPASATLTPGKKQPFTATVQRAADQTVVWSPNAPGGLYTAPDPLVSTATDVTVTAKADPTANAIATVTLIPNAAVFVKSDTVTRGNWRGVYGSNGYVLADTPEDRRLPSYLPALDTSALALFTWENPTADLRGLQKPTGADRFAVTWFDDTSLTLDFDFRDSVPHQVTLYCIDWTSLGRAQQIDMLPHGAATPDTRNLSAFVDGRYLVWNLTGKVHLTITQTAGPNAVLGAIFFD